MALAGKYRLRKETDINKVFSKGRTIKSGLFFAKSLPNGLPYSRIAVTVSKKVSTKAVERNLIKRRIQEAVEKKYLRRNGLDVLIVTLPPILGKPFQEIKSEIDKTITKLLGQ